ncbi:expressed unknown protein [Seminavis robusta]|uniref:G-protein coupled receptors family 2 profile 2 domain-containing protein n=1 Tax=Seminavis robusta TaxID=568900 RepID=A0A9N8ERP3_9STRA|nr:expressed unknown protein [Seminavis robusta]|eukprot:Sro1515_g278970.1 n/a (391) ;mRNA; f:2284-3456
MSTIEIEPIYTESQLKALALVIYIPTTLSLIGSSSIIYSVLSSFQKRSRSKTYDRIMLGLSCMEAVCALGLLVFGSWAVPKEASSMAYGARGTTATCAVAGVFAHILFGTMMYTAMLALYFCLRVRFQLTEDFIAHRIEPFLHLFPVMMVVVFSVIGLAGGYFNPLDRVSGLCWFKDYPPDCTTDPDVDCIRGENHTGIARIAASGAIFLAFLIIIICMALLLFQIMALEHRLRRYAHGANSTTQWKRSQEVGKQALQYIGFFFLCGVWPVVGQIVIPPAELEYNNINFPIALMTKLMTPMQGLFNAIIFWNRRWSEAKRFTSSGRTAASSAAKTTVVRKQVDEQDPTQALEDTIATGDPERTGTDDPESRHEEAWDPKNDEADSFHDEE